MSIPQFEAPQVEDLQDLLPTYEIIDFIAKGGMGAVYRARQISLDREVAIKILPSEFGENEDFRKGFEAEARAMARLNHPNLIGVYDCGEVEGMPYIVMEYVKGKALYYSAKGVRIDPIEAVNLTLGICKGLAHAHAADILHRDIKPANILLDADKQPKVGDFGLAHTIDSEEGAMLLFGTPGYSAPEVLHNSGKISKQSDVFSIGVLFYELLTGELPGEDFVSVTEKASVDARYDRLIRRALDPDPDPDRRFDDARELANEFEKLLNASPVIINADASPLPSPAISKPGTAWSMWRTLAMIAILLVPIYFATKAYKQKNDIIGQDEITSNEPAPPPNKPRVPETPRKKDQKPKPSVRPKPLAEPPLEALARLRQQLFDGERSHFPPSTFESSDLRYLFVETPMTWHEAGTFAEKHGGHLSSIRNLAVANRIAKNIPADTAIWLGGGPVGNNDWAWVDGSDWTLGKPESGIGIAAALTARGEVQSKSSDIRYPFIIQWHMSGKNPGSLKNQLLRTKASLDNNVLGFPPGTFSLDSRHYLVIARPTNWDFAAAIATQSGGHLAVPVDKAENDFLQKELSTILGNRRTCWIGSKFEGGSFSWTTSEPWKFAAWAPGFPKPNAREGSGVRLLTGPNGGWQHAPPRDRNGTDAFVIEWSRDHTAPIPDNHPDFGEDLAKLQTKVKTAINHHRNKHEENILTNVKDFRFNLNAWPKRQLSKDAQRWAPSIQKVLTCIGPDGKLTHPPRPIPLPRSLSELVVKSFDKQAHLNKELDDKLEILRKAYIKELQELRKKPSGAGLKSKVQLIDRELKASGNLAGLLRHLNIATKSKTNPPTPPTPFIDWLRTVEFLLSDGSRMFIEGRSMRQRLPDGKLIEFNKTIDQVNAGKQTVSWTSAGKKASLSIAADRKSGVWTTIHRKKHQVTVIPKK